jgi:hypothetical protein
MVTMTEPKQSTKDLQLIRDLRDRVAKLELLVFRAVVVVAVAALAVSLFVPFLSATDPDTEDGSITLASAIAALSDAGDGPFSGQAAIAGVAVAVVFVLAVVTLIVVAMLLRARSGRRALLAASRLSVGLFVVCLFGWLLVLVLAAHFEGDVSAFSPALACLTAGAVVGSLTRNVAPESMTED